MEDKYDDALDEQLDDFGTDDELTEDDLARIEHTDDAVIVTLVAPITFKPSKLDGERTLEVLTLPRSVKGKHLMAMDKAAGEMGKTLALLAALARIPMHAAQELDGRDVNVAMQAITPFLPRPRRTGKR